MKLKGNISKLLIILLGISIIIVSIKYKNLVQEYKLQQLNTDNVFRTQLIHASSALSNESITVEKDKNYNDGISDIKFSVELFPFTSFAKNNDGLMRVLDDSLCNLMKQEEYKQEIILESQQIKEYLSQLSYNPEDKQATDNLEKLTRKIREKRWFNWNY